MALIPPAWMGNSAFAAGLDFWIAMVCKTVLAPMEFMV